MTADRNAAKSPPDLSTLAFTSTLDIPEPDLYAAIASARPNLPAELLLPSHFQIHQLLYYLKDNRDQALDLHHKATVSYPILFR